MHPDQTSDNSGKCPKCGMELSLSSASDLTTDVYKCPDHVDAEYHAPGKCPKCQKDLLKSPKEKMKLEVVGKYVCPDHPDVISTTPANCTKCQKPLKNQNN